MGSDFEQVHVWLDETARGYFPWCGHRQIRHHDEGVEQIRRMWGDEAARAAELHIISDFGHVPTKEEIKEAYGPSPFADDNGEYPVFPAERSGGWDGVYEFDR